LRLFVCHASEDKPPLRELVKRLREDGFDPWFDEERLIPGQVWQLEIGARRHLSKHALLPKIIHSETTKHGSNCQFPVRLGGP
jgi:hypothetical protein